MSNENNNNDPVNNEKNDDKLSPSQAATVLGPKFREVLNRKLDERIASLKAEIEELEASNMAWENNVKIKCRNFKETKKEIKETKKLAEELKRTRDNLREVGRDLADYNWFLQLDLEKYQAETIQLKKVHENAIEDMDNKWKTYQAQYETLPLAVVRTNAAIALKKSKIELMVEEYKLQETKKMISKRKEIETKQRNNLVIEIAKLYKESQAEDARMHLVMEERKNLLRELAEHEKMIAELEKKQKENKSAPQAVAIHELRNIFSSQKKPQKILPRLNLSFCGASPMQPLPVFRKDNFDTVSISSSVIDNLIEPESDNLRRMKITEYEIEAEAQGRENGDDHKTPEAAGPLFVDPTEIEEDLDVQKSSWFASKDKQLNQTPNVHFEVMEVENEDMEAQNEDIGEVEDLKRVEKEGAVFDRFEEESGVVGLIELQEPQQNYNSRGMMEGMKYKVSDYKKNKEADVENGKCDAKATGWQLSGTRSRFFSSVDKSGSSYFPESNFWSPLKPEELPKDKRPEPKGPKVRNIENVHLSLSQLVTAQNKMPLATPNEGKQSDNSSLARYFTANSRASSVDYNWKADLPQSLNFSFTESQRENPEFGYLLGSQVSMQSEDMAKECHLSSAFLPDSRCRIDDYTSEKNTDNNVKRNQNFEASTPRADNPQDQKSANEEEKQVRASQFFNIGGENHGPPGNCGNTNHKKGAFFLNMF